MAEIYHSHRLRNGRVSTSGNAYHIRLATKHRQQQLSDFTIARAVARSIGQEHTTGRTRCLCFCIMPDHVHWLMILKKGSIGRSVHNIKRLSCYLSATSILWQRSFFDHGVRDRESLREIARYIVANPLRANLVNSVGDYPHWDAIWLDAENSEAL